jgi:hypothetical protein
MGNVIFWGFSPGEGSFLGPASGDGKPKVFRLSGRERAPNEENSAKYRMQSGINPAFVTLSGYLYHPGNQTSKHHDKP